MPVKMLPTSTIIANLGIDDNGWVMKYFASEGAKKMDKYVPKNEGILRKYKLEGNCVVYDTPYARYQYYGVREDGTHQVKHYTTKGTGPYWDKQMWSAEGQDLVKKVQKKFGGK